MKKIHEQLGTLFTLYRDSKGAYRLTDRNWISYRTKNLNFLNIHMNSNPSNFEDMEIVSQFKMMYTNDICAVERLKEVVPELFI